MPNEFHPRFLEHLKALAKAVEKEYPSPWTHGEGKVRDRNGSIVGDEAAQLIAHADPQTVLKLLEHVKPPCLHWFDKIEGEWQCECSESLNWDSEPWGYCSDCGGEVEVVDDPNPDGEEDDDAE